MTEETKFQKAALWIGLSRSGKGTTTFIQRKLIGDAAYVGLNFSTWVTNENSRAPLIGKRVGVFPDVRPKPAKHYGLTYDAGGISHASQELLLAITGKDTLTLARKWVGAWHGQLRTKADLNFEFGAKLQRHNTCVKICESEVWPKLLWQGRR